MDWIWTIIIGLIVGAIAALLVPGRTPGGMLGVFLAGLAGALIAGFIFDFWLWVFIFAIVAAAIVIVIVNSVMRRA